MRERFYSFKERKRFYLMRHGETHLNKEKKCGGGQSDVPLNETGLKQAHEAKTKIPSFKKVIVSPMKRAQETAKISLGIDEVQTDPDLREWDMGSFEGVCVLKFMEHTETLPSHMPLEGGESRDQFYKRSTSAILKYIEEHEDPLFVAHGGLYWALVHTLGLPNDFLRNCEVAEFRWDGKTWTVSKF